MNSYFLSDGQKAFTVFSTVHWLTLIVFVCVAVLLFLFRRVLRKKRINFIARFTLFFMLIMSEISLHVWLYWMDAWGYKHSLPLHLSSVTLLLSAVLLLTKRFSLFEFTYFAGVGSALQAMLTPDISEYTFPHYRYVHFFVSHGGTVIANLFIVFVEGFRPTFRSVWKAFLWLNVYVVFIIFVNFFLGGNYMYLAEKPVNPSMLDYLGPWPVYILPLEVITVVTFLLLYVPFWLLALWKKKEL